MTRYGGLGIVVLSALLIGCQTKPPPPLVQPPALGYDEIRDSLLAGDPRAVVGQVSGTRPEDNLVLINDVDPGRLQLGDAVSFLDSREQVLTIGRVTSIASDGNIVVHIEAPAAGIRLPQIGDVAVHIPPGPAPASPPPVVPPDMTNPAPPVTPAPAPENPAPAPTPAPAPAPATQPADSTNTPPATLPASTTIAPPANPVPLPVPPPPAPPTTEPEMNK